MNNEAEKQQAQQRQTLGDAIREQFEKWIVQVPRNRSVKRHTDGQQRYVDNEAQMAWEAWQAAWTHGAASGQLQWGQPLRPGLTREEFSRLYQNEWKPDPLARLAEEYHRRCDAFDVQVCTGKSYDGSPGPANSHEMGLVNRNAHMVRRELCERARVDVREFMAAVHRHGRRQGGG